MYFPPTKANPRRLFVLCVSLLATSAIYLYLHTSFRATGDLPVLGVPSDQQHGRCDLPRQIDDVFVVLKTGANDALGAVPAHVATTLRCIPHYIIYSDMEEDIDGHHLYDVLAEVDPVIQETNPEFEYYRRLREKGREAFSAEESARWSSAQNTVGGKDSPGWKLDKWKFLPMAEQALRARPNAKWYVIIESDSYVLWGNLLRWLSGFDASKPYYLGMQMQVDDIIFAYGGSGIILSRPALEKVVRHRQDNLKSYDEFTAAHWAGDCVLGKALSDAGVDLFFSWPNVFTESPVEMNFNYSIGDLRPWCHHVASYHHLKPADILEFSEFEKSHPVGNKHARSEDLHADERNPSQTSCNATEIPSCIIFSLGSNRSGQTGTIFARTTTRRATAPLRIAGTRVAPRPTAFSICFPTRAARPQAS